MKHQLLQRSKVFVLTPAIRKLLLLAACIPVCPAMAQTSLKMENGGGPGGSGPSTTNKTVTMYYGDGAAYSPTLTVTYSLSEQQYLSIEGNPGIPGVAFGGNLNGSGNTAQSLNYYMLMNSIGGSTNTHYSTDGATPAINVGNDYGIEIITFGDALINAVGSNLISTNSKNVHCANLTLTFSRPVTNPIIHFSGLGGTAGALGISTSFELLDDYEMTRLAGNTYFQVSGDTIKNSAPQYTAATRETSPSGASGSAKVSGGGISSLTFKVYMNGDGGGSAWSTTSRVTGDGFLISASLTAGYDISGTVHNDNDNGTPDGPVYEGATVKLYDSDGNEVGSTTTDADGNYTFPEVPPGDYTVVVTPPAGFEVVGSSEGDADGSTPVTVSSAPVTDVDFGINEPPVAADDNLSGQSPGSAATLDILGNDSDPNGGTLSPDGISLVTPSGATDVTTDADGDVTGFTVPGEGSWALNGDGSLTFTPESGFTGDPTPVQYTVRDAAGLVSEPATVTIDYNDPVTVSGTVYNDNDGGDPDGTPYEGATVTLYNSAGEVVGTATTDADGNYTFTDVTPGDYTVVITTPSGFEVVGSSEGDADGSTPITVGSDPVTAVDFGINEPPVATDDTLSGQSPGSAATLDILGNDSDPNGGALNAEGLSLVTPSGATDVTTDAEGDVTGFTVPGEGSWALNGDGTLTFTPESGFTGDPTPIQYTVRDAAGLVSEPATVTIDYNDPVNVSGTVYNDNDNGTPDGTPYEGATVTLYNSAGEVVGTATTDADGNYTFTDVAPGDYTVVITSPSGFEVVGSSEGDADGSTPVTVGSESVSGVDFGINESPVAADDNLSGQSPGSAATLDILGNDSDPNGGTLSPDGISLVTPSGATDVTTDADGDVTGFTVPGEGSWALNGDGTLTFTPESGFTGDPTPIQYTVRDAAGLVSEPATVTIDYNDPVTVSGTVYNDNDGGDPDGTPYEGATVTLYNSVGEVAGTATTDADGNYTFTDVTPGDYTVVITSPSGFEVVGSSEGDADGSTPVTVGSDPVTAVDFGINEPPVATDDSLGGQSTGSAATVNILENDSDPNGGALNAEGLSLVTPSGATDVTTDDEGDVTGFTMPGEGSWALNGDGTLTFTPESGFTGDPTPIQYTVRDAAGLVSEPATVTIDYEEPMPVTLLSFEAAADNCHTVLSWSTGAEDKFSSFEVERSLTGREFTKIGSLESKGDNSRYELRDEFPAEGKNYYRLKMMDIDGGYTYSSTCNTTVQCNDRNLQIYPNPADNVLHIDGLKGQEQLSVTDVSGREVRKLRAEVPGSLVMDVSGLPAGMYTVNILHTSGHTISSHKFVKR